MPQSTICSTSILQTVMGQNIKKIVAYDDMRPVMSKYPVPELLIQYKNEKWKKGRAKREKKMQIK